MLEQIKPYKKEEAQEEAQKMQEQIRSGAESYNEAESLLDLEKIKDHFDSNQELKKKYIKDIKFHESKEKIILEVIVNGDGLNQDYFPTEEQYKILKYLTAGEYPNSNNIVHVNSTQGYNDTMGDLDTLLSEKMERGRGSGGGGYADIKSSGFFCSPSNSWFSCAEKNQTFIFKPEGLDRFFKKTVENLFGMSPDKYMSEVVKPILNSKDVLQEAVAKGSGEYSDGMYEENMKHPKQLLNNESKELNISHKSIVPVTGCHKDGDVPQKLIQGIVGKYGGGLYKGYKSTKGEKIGPFTVADLVGFCNLTMHVAHNYLKLVHDKTETSKDLKSIGKQLFENTEDVLSGDISINGINEKNHEKILGIFTNINSYDGKETLLNYSKSKHIKFMDREDIEQLKLKGDKLEEMSWAYLSKNGCNEYGFFCLVKNGDENLKFDDASVIISKSSINSKTYDIKKEDGPRVLFIKKK